jgi:hypothetical protein
MHVHIYIIPSTMSVFLYHSWLEGAVLFSLNVVYNCQRKKKKCFEAEEICVIRCARKCMNG